jgi:hypothetical protein
MKKDSYSFFGCIKCGKGEVNYPIWVHQIGLNPPDCYCEREELNSDGENRLVCEQLNYKNMHDRCCASWTQYVCDTCLSKDKEKISRKRFLRPVNVI